MALMSAVALLIVHRSLSRVPHALVWSAAFTLAAARWGYAAHLAAGRSQDLVAILLFDLLGLTAALLFAEGFRLRSGSRRHVPTFVACLAVPALVVLFAFPPAPLRAAIVPLVSLGLLGWSMTMVTPRSRRWLPAEVAVIVMLGLLAAVHLTAIGFAIGEQIGLLDSHYLFLMTYLATLGPTSAASGLCTLLLICFDFSTEQRRLVHTDPLTGVLNRLGFEHHARNAILRARRRTRTLSLAIADIDEFKGINDRDGHAAGDATLVGFAQHLAGGLDRGARVGRIGGEEFVLLLPGHDGPAALAKVEPMRAGLAELSIPDLPHIRVTASFGIAEHRPDATLAETIALADAALYRSKREGRDRSTLAPPGDG